MNISMSFFQELALGRDFLKVPVFSLPIVRGIDA
jgi:hypothetical protein